MKFLDYFRERYTTKTYDSTQKIGSEQLAELKEILRLSPSSINSQPWQFIFVESESLREKLAPASQHNGDKVRNCTAVIVMCSRYDIDGFEEWFKANSPEYAVGYFVNNIKPKGEAAVREWFTRQLYISLGVVLSACATMGIDSTPMEGIDTEKYDKILNIDTTKYRSVVAVALGIRTTDDFNQPSLKPKTRRPLSDVVVSL